MSPQQGAVADRILETLRRAPVCELDDLELRLPTSPGIKSFLKSIV